jgi:hypothetical protein
MAAWAKKEQAKLKADQQKRRSSKVAESNPKAKSRSTPVGKKAAPKKRTMPKGNAAKSRNLWLGR